MSMWMICEGSSHSVRLRAGCDPLVGDGVHEDAYAADFDFHDIPWNEVPGRIEARSRAGRRSSGDHVARLERGEGRDVANEIRDRKEHVVRGVVLPRFAVDASRDPDAAESVELIHGHHPGADRAGLVEVLPGRDVELRVPKPISERAFVHAGQACDVPQRSRRRDAASRLADDDGDFSLVVELRGLRWPEQRSSVADERVRRAHEDAGVSRPLGAVSVFLVAVAVVDSNADDFLRRHDGRQKSDLAERIVGRIARRDLGSSLKALPLEEIPQARVFAQPLGELQDAFADQGAIARAAAACEGEELHGAFSVQSYAVETYSASKFRAISGVALSSSTGSFARAASARAASH